MERRCGAKGAATKIILEKQNTKAVVGVECVIIKPTEYEEVEQTKHAHTMPKAVCSEDSVDKIIRGEQII